MKKYVSLKVNEFHLKSIYFPRNVLKFPFVKLFETTKLLQMGVAKDLKLNTTLCQRRET